MTEETNESCEEVIESIHQIIQITESSYKELEDMKNRLGKNTPDYVEREYKELGKKLQDLRAMEANLIYDKKKENYQTQLNKDNKKSFEFPSIMTLKSFSISAASRKQKSHKATKSTRGIYSKNKNADFITVKLLNNKTVIIRAVEGVSIGSLIVDQNKYPDISKETCALISSVTNNMIPWEADSTALGNISVSVIPLNNSQNLPYIVQDHEFRKIVFSMRECNFCHKNVVFGLKCKRCGVVLHTKCSRNPAYFRSCLNYRKSFSYQVNETPSITILSKVSSEEKDSSTSIIQRNMTPQKPKERMRKSLCAFRPYGKDVVNSDSILVDPHLNVSFNSLEDIGLNRAQSDIKNSQNKSNGDDARTLAPIKNRIVHTKPGEISRYPVNDWEIDSSEIIIGIEIGSGSYGTVFKANWHGYVAVKRLNVNQPGMEDLEAFKNEVNMLRRTRHRNILLFMGCIYQPVLGIVTQWCDGSTLYKHIHILETDFDHKMITDFANQIALGMEYLHAKNIIHRDLKSNNIFLQEANIVKIGDFGLATAKNAATSLLAKKGLQPSGSILWMAPEVIRMDFSEPYTFKSDVYAYGIVLYEMLSYLLPYYNFENSDQILYMVGRGLLKPDVSIIYEDQNKTLFNLMQECIEFNPQQRPFFSYIVQITTKTFRTMPTITRTTSTANFKTNSILQLDKFTSFKMSNHISSPNHEVKIGESAYNINKN